MILLVNVVDEFLKFGFIVFFMYLICLPLSDQKTYPIPTSRRRKDEVPQAPSMFTPPAPAPAPAPPPVAPNLAFGYGPLSQGVSYLYGGVPVYPQIPQVPVFPQIPQVSYDLLVSCVFAEFLDVF